MYSQTMRQQQIAELVATYAPVGARHRQQRLRRRIGLTGVAVSVAAAAALLWQFEPSWLDSMTRLSADTTISPGERRRAEAESAAFTARIAALEQQLVGMQEQKHMLESQQEAIAVQSTRLAQLLDGPDAGETTSETRRDQGALLDEEIAAMAAQREALEKRWAQFEAQGELLAMEIIAINAQRKELESQRRQIDRQKQDLAEMLERAEGLYRRNAEAQGAVDTGDDTIARSADLHALDYRPDTMLVANGELDEMRGGFSIGQNLDISFGFTQTGAINGVEQYRNNFSIGSMGAGIDQVDLSKMNFSLISNGPGNIVSPDAFDALGSNFGSVIQNSLDDQVISTTTIFDLSLHNMPGTVQGMYGEQALTDTLGAFR